MNIIEKARLLPEPKRKLIFWLILITFSVLLSALWIKRVKTRLEQFDLKEVEGKMSPPSLNEDINFPKIDIEEDLKKLEQLLEEEKQKNGKE